MYNKGYEGVTTQRFWYTSAALRKAKTAAAADIGAEKKKRKISIKDNGVKKKAKTVSFKIPKGKQSKKAQPVTKAQSVPNVSCKTPTTPEQGQSLANTETVVYYPVDEEWQHGICNAFGWRFYNRSSRFNVRSVIRRSQHPKRQGVSIRGDGNCFYRAICYIITG